MALDPNKWTNEVPDEASFLKGIIDLYKPTVPWAFPGADIDFGNGIPSVYGDLWTHCFNGFKKFFCERVAEFVKESALVHISDTPPKAFDVADKILSDAGLTRDKDPDAFPNFVQTKFYGAAAPRKTVSELAKVLETYWH